MTFLNHKQFTALCAVVLALNITGAQGQPAAKPISAQKPQAAPRTSASPLTPTVKNPERHVKFLAQAKAGKCGVLFLGDSIIDGWPHRGTNSWARFAKYEPLNFGIGGDHTENVLWRITDGELDGIHPKVAILLIGTNNEGHYKDKPEWVAAAIKKIIETIHAKLPDTKVLLVGVFPRNTKDSENRQLVDSLNEIIKTFTDGQKVRYLDIGSKFLDENGEIPASLMADKLHPTAKGYDIWADAMIPVLDEMMN